MAPWDHLGRPWEQQDGYEVVRNRIFIDSAMIFGSYFDSCLVTEACNCNFCFRLVSRSLFSKISESKFRRSCLLSQDSHMDCFVDSRIVFYRLLEAFGTVCLFFVSRKQLCKLIHFRRYNGSKALRMLGLNHDIFEPCGQLNSRWLIAESMTHNC